MRISIAAKPFLIPACLAGMLPMGCDRAPSPPAASEAEEPTPDATPHPISLELHDELVFQVLHIAAHRARRTLVIEPGAQWTARHARISLVTPGPLPPEQLLWLLQATLKPTGLRIEPLSDRWIVRHERCEDAGPCLDIDPAGAWEKAPDASGGGAPKSDELLTKEALRGIQKVSDTRYKVSRRARDAALELMARMLRSARVVPVLRNGKVDGIPLFGGRPGGVMEALGLRNGDVLMAVLGVPIGDPQNAMALFAKVLRASEVPVKFRRNGEVKTIVSTIVPP